MTEDASVRQSLLLGKTSLLRLTTYGSEMANNTTNLSAVVTSAARGKSAQVLTVHWLELRPESPLIGTVRLDSARRRPMKGEHRQPSATNNRVGNEHGFPETTYLRQPITSFCSILFPGDSPRALSQSAADNFLGRLFGCSPISLPSTYFPGPS